MDERRKPLPAHEIQAEQDMIQIESLVQQLKGYEIDRPYGENDASDIAFAILLEVLEPYKDTLLKEKFLTTCHGSMEFHDPHTLDSDVHLIGKKKHKRGQEISDDLYASLHEREDWPTIPGAEKYLMASDQAEVEYFNFSSLQADAKRYLAGEIYDEDDNGVIIAVSVLISKIIFPEQVSLLAEMQTEVRKILRSSPQMRQIVVNELQGIIAERIQRRKEIKKKQQNESDL